MTVKTTETYPEKTFLQVKTKYFPQLNQQLESQKTTPGIKFALVESDRRIPCVEPGKSHQPVKELP